MEDGEAKPLISCLWLTSRVYYLLLEASLLRSFYQTSRISSVQAWGKAGYSQVGDKVKRSLIDSAESLHSCVHYKLLFLPRKT